MNASPWEAAEEATRPASAINPLPPPPGSLLLSEADAVVDAVLVAVLGSPSEPSPSRPRSSSSMRVEAGSQPCTTMHISPRGSRRVNSSRAPCSVDLQGGKEGDIMARNAVLTCREEWKVLSWSAAQCRHAGQAANQEKADHGVTHGGARQGTCCCRTDKARHHRRGGKRSTQICLTDRTPRASS